MTYALMNETLPTIIGMGVVSQTTTTMFGKKGTRARGKTRKKQTTFKIYQGKKGGKYLIRKGRKIYI